MFSHGFVFVIVVVDAAVYDNAVDDDVFVVAFLRAIFSIFLFKKNNPFALKCQC